MEVTTVRKIDAVMEERFVSLIPALERVTGGDGFDRVPDAQKSDFLATLEAALALVPAAAATPAAG